MPVAARSGLIRGIYGVLNPGKLDFVRPLPR